MKLQSLTIIFIIIILPVVLVLSAYIGYEIKTIEKQNMYNTGIISATHDAIFSFEINSKNDKYSNNAQTKRDVLKSAVKTFENSLSVNCNLGIYGNEGNFGASFRARVAFARGNETDSSGYHTSGD